jgi:pilus assembly protein Flp/PilA
MLDKTKSNFSFKQFVADEKGATSIEYGVVIAVLAVGIVVSAGALGAAINGKFATAATAAAKK